MKKKLMAALLGATLLSMDPVYAQSDEQKMIELAQRYEAAYFEHNSEVALFWGRTEATPDKFMDHSYAARTQWHRQEDAFLHALNKLDNESFKSSSIYTTYTLLKQTLENNKQARVCNEPLWAVNPMFGWHNIMTSIAEKQAVGTPEHRAAALARWQSFDDVVNQEMDNLKLGLKLGFSAPKPAVTRVIHQLDLMLSDNVYDSPFFDMARRDNDATFKTAIAGIITNTINPALQRYQNYLKNDYLPKARSEIGVWSLPKGGQCYQAKIKQETTIDITPDQIHQLGLTQMQRLMTEVAQIGNKEFGIENMHQIFQQAKTGFLFSSEQDILNYNMAALERAKRQAPQWFDKLPKADGIIKPYPYHRAVTGAAGEYWPPNDDGIQPGIFYINTHEPTKRSRVDQEATLFHELIPGHHFQIALSYEDKSQHNLNRYLWNAGYGEGWALYVERLADEMGLYRDDISRLGMLSNEALRTARLVVDSGIHHLHWTRAEAIDYLTEHSALNANIVESEVDRYIMMPGQANAYMIGKLEIERLRQFARSHLQEVFDIREFHNQVLKNGAVSLPMLAEQIEAWVAHDGQG